ncbi:MAG: hypothetical protein F6K54_27260 [Okeania sp. SIO3B5]|uniref:hypothetical protein n=1 Tax=Okeania sp. SIO3B5 TaxID=2607811 RepID=UPI0013FFEE55|nr:hypothetical protein [Okeania sp. SIO3B5]NEO56456.1 hypothetical protein [Okeania sp. SIO3B5]
MVERVWGDGEMGGWGDGEMGRLRDWEIGRLGDWEIGGLGVWEKLKNIYLLPLPCRTTNFFIITFYSFSSFRASCLNRTPQPTPQELHLTKTSQDELSSRSPTATRGKSSEAVTRGNKRN